MNNFLSLSLKITNWCNLNCLHCCENSGCKEPTNFMPLAKIEQYLHEFREIPVNISNHVVIGGGEGMAPYLFGDSDYIPTALRCILKAGCIPTIKTNGMWGIKSDIRMKILKDLAQVAYVSGKFITLDISIDEFHNNISQVASIVASILSDDFIMSGVAISLVGFNTKGSVQALFKLCRELIKRNLLVEFLQNGDLAVYNSRRKGFRVFLSFVDGVYDLGRAKKNEVYTAKLDSKCLAKSDNCFSIDNNDVATLNYVYSEKIAGRKLQTVFESIIRKYGD